MRLVSRLAIMLLIALPLAGCANNRRWGPCALAGGIIGGTAGALGGGFGVNEYEPTATDEEVFGGAGAGMAVGMLIGTVVGHYVCDPVDEPPSGDTSRR
jgi:hypothetical protein